jgi:hypothetical protein
MSFAAEGSVLFLLELTMEEVEGLKKKGCFRLLKQRAKKGKKKKKQGFYKSLNPRKRKNGRLISFF